MYMYTNAYENRIHSVLSIQSSLWMRWSANILNLVFGSGSGALTASYTPSKMADTAVSWLDGMVREPLPVGAGVPKKRLT